MSYFLESSLGLECRHHCCSNIYLKNKICSFYIVGIPDSNGIMILVIHWYSFNCPSFLMKIQCIKYAKNTIRRHICIQLNKTLWINIKYTLTKLYVYIVVYKYTCIHLCVLPIDIVEKSALVYHHLSRYLMKQSDSHLIHKWSKLELAAMSVRDTKSLFLKDLIFILLIIYSILLIEYVSCKEVGININILMKTPCFFYVIQKAIFYLKPGHIHA